MKVFHNLVANTMSLQDDLMDLLLVGTPTEVVVTACGLLRKLGDIPLSRVCELEAVAKSNNPHVAAEGCKLLQTTPHAPGREMVFIAAMMRHPWNKRIVRVGLRELTLATASCPEEAAVAVLKVLKWIGGDVRLSTRACQLLGTYRSSKMLKISAVVALLPNATTAATVCIFKVLTQVLCISVTSDDVHIIASALARHVHSVDVAENGCRILERLLGTDTLGAIPELGQVLFAVHAAAVTHTQNKNVIFLACVLMRAAAHDPQTFFNCGGPEVVVLAGNVFDIIDFVNVIPIPVIRRRFVIEVQSVAFIWRDNSRVVEVCDDVLAHIAPDQTVITPFQPVLRWEMLRIAVK